MFIWLKQLRSLFLRKFVYRCHQIGPGFRAGKGVQLWARNPLKIGTNFYIGRYSQIECDAEIGNHVIFANHVSLVGRYDHHYQQVGVPIAFAQRIRQPGYNWKGLYSKVIICDDVWVGLGSIILSGVTIGEGSIIAAGSVVTKDVEPYSIYAGNPARKIRDRFETSSELDEHKRRILEQTRRGRGFGKIKYAG